MKGKLIIFTEVFTLLTVSYKPSILIIVKKWVIFLNWYSNTLQMYSCSNGWNDTVQMNFYIIVIASIYLSVISKQVMINVYDIFLQSKVTINLNGPANNINFKGCRNKLACRYIKMFYPQCQIPISNIPL